MPLTAEEGELAPPSLSSASRRSYLVEIGVPLFACLLGLLLIHHPMLLSGMARIQTDRFDTRLNNFILEHGYLWLRGDPAHRDFWSPGVFYPIQNTFAFSETLLGVAPFYWLCRWLGVPADTSFQLWMLSQSALNFVAAYLALRLCARMSPVAAAAGAFLFAFGSPRIAHTTRQQLLAQFYTPIAICAAAQAFRSHCGGRRWLPTAAWIFLFVACVVAQLYACFYLGWFLVIGLGVAVFWGLALRECRATLLRLVVAHSGTLVVAGALGLWVLAPMLSHYSMARGQVPKRNYIDALNTMPTWSSWWYMGTQSWCYGWTAWTDRVFGVSIGVRPEPIGMGVVTTLLAAAGLWRERRRAWVRLFALVAASLLLYTLVAADQREVCRAQFKYIPGAYAVRASHRVVFIMLLPAALGLAVAVERFASNRSRLALVALLAWCALEQGRQSPSYDKYQARRETAALARRVDPRCDAFFLSPVRGITDRYHVDALWVHIATGIPTINGHSGSIPIGWPLLNLPVTTPQERREVREALDDWTRRTGVGSRKICWVEVPDP